MNGAPRGSQNCGVASSDGDTQPTSSSMRANPAQPQTGATADSFPQSSEISTSTQPPAPSALQQTQSLSLAGPSSGGNLQGSSGNAGSFPLLPQSVLQQPAGWNTVDLSSLYSPLRFGRGVNQANSSGTVDSVTPRALLPGSSSASASSLTGIPSSSGSFTNVVTLPSQAASQILQMLNAGIGSNILAQYQYFCTAANQRQHQVTQAMTASSSQQQSSSTSSLGLPAIPNLSFEQLQRFLVNLQQQHLSNQIFPQSILRAVNQFSPLSAQIRNALASPINPFPPNAAVLAAAAAQHQRLPAPVPASVRTGTPLSPTPGTSGLQAGKISGDSAALIPSAFTPNIHSSSATKAVVSPGSFSPSSDELSPSKSGVRLRQNTSQSSSLMLPPPFPRSRNPSVALPCPQQKQRQSALPYQRPPQFASESIPLHSYHPSHFMKGTVIQLQSGQLKRVEDMNTDDFVRSAAMNTDLILCYSTVRDIKNAGKERQVIVTFFVEQKKAEVSIEADIEHPYFVVDQGWASCNPEKTRNSYGLTCRQLQVGDVCIAVYDAGKEETNMSTKTSVSVSAVLTSSNATIAETAGENTAAGKYDGQSKQQQDDDNKFWRSSIMQPPSSGNISQSSSDGISQVSVRERSESSN